MDQELEFSNPSLLKNDDPDDVSEHNVETDGETN